MQPQAMHVGCRLETTSEHLKRRQKNNLQQSISLQGVGQNPTDSGKWLYSGHLVENSILHAYLAGGAYMA